MKRLRPYLLPVLLLNATGILTWWFSQQANELNIQLAYSTSVLKSDNILRAEQPTYLLYRIETAVATNHNQPRDVAHFRLAKALHGQVSQLLPAFYNLDSLIRRAAGQATNATGMRQPAQPVFTKATAPIAQRWQALRRQLAICADSLRRTNPVAAPRPTLPEPASGITAVQALADLARAENQLLCYEVAALQHLEKATPAYTLPPTISTAVATAESNVVAPGSTYRAELLLVDHFPADSSMAMSCNGRPVPIDSHGVGQVRFRAPTRPGPATWTGTIRINQNGRDTTFKVTVPYRVARR